MDSDLDLLKSLRILAFSAVKNKDSEYMTRFLCRWFVKEGFGTLADAEETPIEIILQHYLETKYEELEDEELEKEGKLLTETEQERKDREKAEELAAQADADFLRQATEAAATMNDASKLLTNLTKPNDKLNYKPNTTPLKTDAPIASTQAPIKMPSPESPPDIKMEFVSEDELGDLDNWNILGPPKPIP